MMSLLCLWTIRMRRSEHWQDGLHDWYTCRDDQCSVESARISSGASQRRSSSSIYSCLRRRSVSVRTNSQISTPCECDFPQCLKRPCCRASTEAISCCLVPTLFPCTSLFSRMSDKRPPGQKLIAWDVRLSAWLPVCMYVCMSVCICCMLYVIVFSVLCLSVYLFICYLCVCMYMYMCMCMSMCV